MKELIKKENEIFDILNKFVEKNLDFVIVGGYAVSAFKHRFSVDADIVINSDDLSKFEDFLKKQGFKETISKDLDNIYSSKFRRYEKDDASIDLMIGALASRTTDATFSFKLLSENSTKRKIIGIEKEVYAKIPEKELLIVMKLHSGRLTDFRDIAAMAKNTDIKKIKKFLFIGNLKVIKENLKKLNSIVENKNFIDSFKGVFMEKKFDIDFEQVKRISKLNEDED
ncbi:hypothetical protein HYX16_06570 [Candidatus Woesearchaeota archaeon]|nr:hypothetical protein [Candidatus Woesearchaeota archaeon]